MWELIRANKQKSIVLFISMGFLLIILGYTAGKMYSPEYGGIAGVSIAVIIWVVLSLVSRFKGSSILLKSSKAVEVKPDVYPQLYNIVEEMKIAAGFPGMPKIYIINVEAPNAFATGMNSKDCAIAVTAGLIAKLNRDELQGVIAHEFSHIINQDVKFITYAGIMMGAIVIFADIMLRGFAFGGPSRRYSGKSSRGGGELQIIIIVAAVILAILAPIFARLLYFAISRKREYLADASAVRLTRYPEGLASALEKIASSDLDLPYANKVTAPMYIANPLKKKGRKLKNLTSTHPPINERINILRSMMYGVNYNDYQKAFSSVKKVRTRIIPGSGLMQMEKIDIRKHPELSETHADSAKSQRRTLGDVMMAVNKYIFLTCVCGLKLKIPPSFKRNTLTCPKCGRMNEVKPG